MVKTRVQQEETQMGVSRASGTAALRSKEQECSEVRCMECDPHFGQSSYVQSHCHSKTILRVSYHSPAQKPYQEAP